MIVGSSVAKAASHAVCSVSQPMSTPLPPYSSFGFSTRPSRLALAQGNRSIRLPAGSSVMRSSTTRVQGMWARTVSRSTSVRRWALRSSLMMAKLAFLCSSLQAKGFTTQMAPASTASIIGWANPYVCSSSVSRIRLYTKSTGVPAAYSCASRNSISSGPQMTALMPFSLKYCANSSNSLRVGTSCQSTIAISGNLWPLPCHWRKTRRNSSKAGLLLGRAVRA